jgi:hypothetical protein
MTWQGPRRAVLSAAIVVAALVTSGLSLAGCSSNAAGGQSTCVADLWVKVSSADPVAVTNCSGQALPTPATVRARVGDRISVLTGLSGRLQAQTSDFSLSNDAIGRISASGQIDVARTGSADVLFPSDTVAGLCPASPSTQARTSCVAFVVDVR